MHELAGTKVGVLTIIEVVRVGKGYRAKCRCQCGREISKTLSRLVGTTSGVTRSCGDIGCDQRFNRTRPRQRIKKGYREIWDDGKYRLEHRVLVERDIGRRLLPTEEVHHVDGDRLNNDISNLVIFDRAAHSREHKKLRQLLAKTLKENSLLRQRIAELTIQATKS